MEKRVTYIFESKSYWSVSDSDGKEDLKQTKHV